MTDERTTLKNAIHQYLTDRTRDGLWFLKTVSFHGMQRVGTPDWLVCYRGLFIGIEAKHPTDLTATLSAVQRREAANILRAGGVVMLARSVEEVEHVFDWLDTRFRDGRQPIQLVQPPRSLLSLAGTTDEPAVSQSDTSTD